MSLYSLQPRDPQNVEMVVVGWDPALHTLYARVVPTAYAPEDAASLWIGHDRHQILNPADIINAVRPYADVPNRLAHWLRRDAAICDRARDITPSPARHASRRARRSTREPQPRQERGHGHGRG